MRLSAFFPHLRGLRLVRHCAIAGHLTLVVTPTSRTHAARAAVASPVRSIAASSAGSGTCPAVVGRLPSSCRHGASRVATPLAPNAPSASTSPGSWHRGCAAAMVSGRKCQNSVHGRQNSGESYQKWGTDRFVVLS